ncbi:gliding motility lipoprotein GldB [Marixanthomonas spongiae]|uniref:Gliding motility lipoprotein GldB n=1 Tax=Marixanthomonas spongiae TaxID=2174845 RepID=A0A2U0I7L0_9FLAO|nr:gliding motility lipoprotein GldB [Marixanthomonas spongiae]PVW17087.1 gliding motility lipoprotein GldB [Marixanthomonas spongiae]
MKYYLLLCAAVLFMACDSKTQKEKEIEAIPVDVEVVRFDKAFAAATIQDIPKLKKEYPLFFPKQFADSVWVNKVQDTLQHQLETEVSKKFPDNAEIEDELTPLFQHIKYYFPDFKVPTVYTVTSDVDYNNKVIATDTMLVVALDAYLGSDHRFYEGIQKYIANDLKPSQLAPDVASVYARQLIARPQKRTLLAQMIFFGKELYLKDLWLPKTPDSEIIGYSEAEMLWAQDNEEYMWRYFVEKELLYSTNPKLPARFINKAPFSKFYLEIDNESPGMLGRYLGWQIVQSYMENNSVSLKKMLREQPETIFNNSKYKPKK